VLLLVAAAASATGASRQIATDTWTSTKPGTSSGRSYSVDFVNPDDPSGKPPSLSHVHLRLPSGASFDTEAITQCGATDEQLILVGPASCPAASNLGTMALTFDTGFSPPLRYLDVTVTFFNNRNQLIFLSQDNSSGVRTVSRATVTRTTLDSDLPFLPGTPPDGAADKQERATFRAASSASGNYLTTPATCPASGKWVEYESYTYRDGISQTVPIAEPCIASSHPRRQSTTGNNHQRRRRRRGIPKRHHPSHRLQRAMPGFTG
jgi:hypothetical protein